MPCRPISPSCVSWDVSDIDFVIWRFRLHGIVHFVAQELSDASAQIGDGTRCRSSEAESAMKAHVEVSFMHGQFWMSILAAVFES